MTNNNYYNYNSCSSKGSCSTNPRTSSLQELLILYLKYSAFYAFYLENNNLHNSKIKNLILNTISVMITNPEFSESDFLGITSAFEKEIPLLIKQYNEYFKDNSKEPKYNELKNFAKKERTIIESIKLGEKEFLTQINTIPDETRNLYNIMFIIAKSICINILNLQTYGLDENSGYKTILKLLNFLNNKEINSLRIKNYIIEISKFNKKLMENIRNIQEEFYGKQKPVSVSYSTTKGKAILVVGSNIRELELLLESVKNEDVDIYTHDKMLLAHTFPKFSTYKNLKGHYGQGMDNYLPDFATFPGPILLTRHSLYNAENLYRGQLYTTDMAYTKGVIRIKNSDFTPIIDAAKKSKGFKTGKQCACEFVGYDFNEVKNRIEHEIRNKNYTRIFILGNNNYTEELSEYFKIIIKKSSSDTLLISLAVREGGNNLISYNACYDVYAIIKLMEYLDSISKLPVTLFMPECRRHSVSILIYLKSNFNIEIFAGKCSPMSFNPAVMDTINKVFSINLMSDADKDLDKINKIR